MPSDTLTHGGDHAPVADALANHLARNRYIGTFREISFPELTGIVDHVLKAYAAWNDGQERELTACRDFLSNVCYVMSIPITEAAYALYVVRDGLLAIISSGHDPEKHESSGQVAKFFDRLVVELMRGCSG